MALNIKDPETDRMARELAAAAGESITTATRRALAERLERVRARAESLPMYLSDVIARGRARAILDDRPESDVLG